MGKLDSGRGGKEVRSYWKDSTNATRGGEWALGDDFGICFAAESG
jgi:hypothetical protein